jgi:hypothetical protein
MGAIQGIATRTEYAHINLVGHYYFGLSEAQKGWPTARARASSPGCLMAPTIRANRSPALSGRNIGFPFHCYSMASTCSKVSSNSATRPKMLTSTLTRPFSGFTSSTVPLKFANGPSITRT